MIRLLRVFGIVAVVLGLALVGVWGGLAIWFRAPLPEVARLVVSGFWGLGSVATMIAYFGPFRWRTMGLFALFFAGLVVWWNTLQPPETGNWATDVSRQVTGDIDENILTLTNVREFEWRTNTDFTEQWTTRTYDLDRLTSVDMFLSYWAGPEMAHFILSFGFSDGQFLAWSVEVRREVDGGFSPVADFFKENTLVIVAASEQDVVGVRSNVRGEDVQLFRLNARPEQARALLEEYVSEANALARVPQWYNSVTTNCTTVVFKMMKAIGNGYRFDWRIIANGYLPDYGYDQGALNTTIPLGDLRALGRIAPRALAIGLNPQFSNAIRLGVPTPN
ncbi:DUF4105 domain-containing protein (plasmid) [Rhodobacteraceae bacterium M382]|nr:DUF4105 domain-containing protein [Rhodobacteraceae bacterium M382]